ncbi:hypothetical protein FRC10_009159 [Ceratobasidium sp. 414]|nr:hypothetical protein FRC10_009159 [Ceratobasidium sp. 414]
MAKRRRWQKLTNGDTEIEEKLNEIKDKTTKIQNAKKQHEMHEVKLENAQKTLQKEENAPDLRDEEEKLKKKLLKHALKRADIRAKTDGEFQRAESTSKKFLEATKAKMDQVSDDMREEFEKNSQAQGDPPPVTEVENDLATKQAKLQLHQPMNHELVRQITALRGKVATQEKKIMKLNSQVERAKPGRAPGQNKWRPALEELVSQISCN